MLSRLKAYLLHVANSNPSHASTTEFYALKERLLRRYGRIAGYDFQEVVHACWGFWDESCGPKCHKCGGTGVYRTNWFCLERWVWLDYVFHRPSRRLYSKPESEINIRGKIEHNDYGKWSSEAQLWLYLVCCEFRLLWRAMCGSRFAYPGWWPLLRLQWVIMPLAMKLRWQRCWCGRPFPTWGSGWQICKRCRKKSEVPF